MYYEVVDVSDFASAVVEFGETMDILETYTRNLCRVFMDFSWGFHGVFTGFCKHTHFHKS